MTEIHFIVTEAAKGGYLAHAVGADIFTETDDLDTLYAQVRDAAHYHFDEGKGSWIIRLHVSREEVIAA